MSEIRYKLVQPNKTVAEGQAWAVILPTGEINLTVITGRAPSLVELDNGCVQVMAENGSVQSRFFIKKGIATIANDSCLVASEQIIPFEKINFEEVEQKAETDSFYQMISDCMKAEKK